VTIVPAGNVGEWSELYTLGFLLTNGGAYAADEDQNSIHETFYKVLEIYLSDKAPDSEIIYRINAGDVAIENKDGFIANVPKSEIESKLAIFFNDLSKSQTSPTFPLESGSSLLNILGKTSISASSAHKTSDLELVYEDNATNLPSPRTGFSIKSQLGAASTLLNASSATNFKFRIIPPDLGTQNNYPEMKKGAVRANVRKLIDLGYKLEFVSLDSANFTNNLELIDSNMPDYLAQMLLTAYSQASTKFSEVAELAFSDEDTKSKQKVFKIKQFLGAVAMGLRPGGYWDGDVTKFKGLIVVKVDGDVVFYYLYNLTAFQEFLFKSVKFEVASTTRHKFGSIYSDGGSDFIKLNLQIRFSK
jgi:type II restriction enzyme